MIQLRRSCARCRVFLSASAAARRSCRSLLLPRLLLRRVVALSRAGLLLHPGVTLLGALPRLLLCSRGRLAFLTLGLLPCLLLCGLVALPGFRLLLEPLAALSCALLFFLGSLGLGLAGEGFLTLRLELLRSRRCSLDCVAYGLADRSRDDRVHRLVERLASLSAEPSRLLAVRAARHASGESVAPCERTASARSRSAHATAEVTSNVALGVTSSSPEADFLARWRL